MKVVGRSAKVAPRLLKVSQRSEGFPKVGFAIVCEGFSKVTKVPEDRFPEVNEGFPEGLRKFTGGRLRFVECWRVSRTSSFCMVYIGLEFRLGMFALMLLLGGTLSLSYVYIHTVIYIYIYIYTVIYTYNYIELHI